MAILILTLIIGLMVVLASKGKNARRRVAFNMLPANTKKKVIAAKRQKQQETDELVTIILPTINHDK